MRKTIALILILVISANYIFAQKRTPDEATFVEYDPGYYKNSILKDIREFKEKKTPKKIDRRFQMDMSSMNLPNLLNLYKYAWHNKPLSQGNTGSCWCFSTISMYESEILRLTNQKVKLSEMYIVYWEYVEKARYFVNTRGESLFAQGSEANAVTRILKQYGIVPVETYTGLKNGRKFHTHKEMYKEMNSFLKSVKEKNAWNEEEVLSTIKSIMNFHMGEPPSMVIIEGQNHTPKEYLTNVLKLNPDDYIEILSYMQEPYYQMVEYHVPDNWWHSKEYFNIPLDVYMKTLRKAIRKGFTVSIGGDVSEAGFSRTTQVAMVPSFDIPAKFINEEARQLRFSYKSTTDDHGIHLVGFYEKNGIDWYLIKDSSSGSRNNDENAPEFGYYFFHEDYIKLKMMGFTIHKDAVSTVLKKRK
jgi:bleomycin hydrolase